MAMSRDQYRALRLLAAAPNGATEAIMLAHGFTVETLGRLGAGWARDGDAGDHVCRWGQALAG
jgi:hypothetical protein